jgi:aspartyl-tRNA(Asn)/glutamyl-tRNA(Gln) amidotransferase subunit A
MSDLEKLGCAQLLELFSQKKLSPVEYIRHTVKSIQSSRLNAIAAFDESIAMDAAKESEKRYMAGEARSLEGLPIGVKDIIETRQLETTYGCDAYKGNFPKEDAFVVGKLKEAGANVSIKTNTSQFALGPTGEVSLGGPVKNPYDETKVSGGSSSGSGAAVAGNLLPGALGTDSGGSIRLPSALCGAVGLKPTFSVVSNRGVLPVCESVDVVGPVTRSVLDNALILNAIAGYNPLDWRSAPMQGKDYTRALKKPVRGMRAAVAGEFFEGPVEGAVREKCMDAVGVAEEKGVQISRVNLGDLGELKKMHQILLMASAHSVHQEDIQKHRGSIYDQVYKRLKSGDVSSIEYIFDERKKNDMVKRLLDAMGENEFLLMPTTQITACDIGRGEEEMDMEGHRLSPFLTYGAYTWIASYSCFPAISIPVGFNKKGLPVGLSIMAKPYGEANLYRFAKNIMDGLEGK